MKVDKTKHLVFGYINGSNSSDGVEMNDKEEYYRSIYLFNWLLSLCFVYAGRLLYIYCIATIKMQSNGIETNCTPLKLRNKLYIISHSLNGMI